MKRLGIAALMVLLSACGREAPATSCDLSATQEISFTNADAPDTLVVQSLGPSCDKAIGLITLRTAEGYPAWSWSGPLSHRFGDAFGAEDYEHMQTFLEAWSRPDIATTQSAPAWTALTSGQTTLDQLTYEDVRVRNLPMLCHFSGTARQTCVFWEPAAGGAGHLLERDTQENE
ncbi:MAG: hypothetical protein H7124_09890 [Phycisphaerales bacterium]|nr:hypothetical protein [Hyphomonadaceae bacterium]